MSDRNNGGRERPARSNEERRGEPQPPRSVVCRKCRMPVDSGVAECPYCRTSLRARRNWPIGRAKKLQLTKQQTLYGAVAAALCFAVLLVFAVVITLKTPEGTIVVRVNRPDAEVSVDDGKMTLKAPGEEPVEIEVTEGEHTLKVTKGGFQTFTDKFKIASGDREVFDVELLPLATPKAGSGQPKAAPSVAKPEIADVEPLPSPDPAAWKGLLPADAPTAAIAPFDAATAKKHQQAWADYLGVAVEEDVDLGEGVKITMVLIPPGEFVMGSTDEEQARFLEEAKAAGEQWAIETIPTEGPRHRVRITRPFRLGRHEVTRGQFRQFMEETGYRTEAERDGKGGSSLVDGKEVHDLRSIWSADPLLPQTDDHPVVHVSWNDATAFCLWLSTREGVDYHLPTEAQWEYACRASTTTAWPCGDNDTTLEEYAWFGASSGGTTHPAGQLKPNGWSLCDMHGNVWEWCADRWATDYYAQSAPNDPSGPPTGSGRVVRGGGWLHHARHCRSALRYYYSPGGRYPDLGLRLAAVLAE